MVDTARSLWSLDQCKSLRGKRLRCWLDNPRSCLLSRCFRHFRPTRTSMLRHRCRWRSNQVGCHSNTCHSNALGPLVMGESSSVCAVHSTNPLGGSLGGVVLKLYAAHANDLWESGELVVFEVPAHTVCTTSATLRTKTDRATLDHWLPFSRSGSRERAERDRLITRERRAAA